MSVTRIFDILPHIVSKFPKPDALAGKVDGKWETVSTQQYADESNLISYGLLALGIGKGDCIATVSNNRPEWNILDMGMLQTGAIHVPMYPTISESDYKFILNDCSAKMIVVSDKELLKKIEHILPEVPSLKMVYTFNSISGAKHWSEIKELGKKNPDPAKLESLKGSIGENDLATLIYTSGTTGTPKGVMLSHKNIVSNFLACEKLPPVDHTCRALSFLPLNHVYERMLTYLYQYLGVSVYYAESIEKIGDNLKEIKPHIFSTVPRLLEKVYDKIVAKGKELTGVKKSLFFWALDLGLRYDKNVNQGAWYNFQLNLANKIIFSKWREALGGNVRVLVSGSAALQLKLMKVFWSARIPVLEGYGLTETSPVICVNTFEPGGCRFGTVGKVINDVTVKIADDGEILCKGPNIMLGYYKRPDLTAEVIDREGWFHTGDIGILEDGKYLKITDRKKEMFKTSGGKYVAPQPIENKMKESPFIEQIMVVGENRNFAAALIVPAFAHLQKWCSENGVPFTTNEEAIRNPKIIEAVAKEVDEYNKLFGKTEQVKKFELLPREWTVDQGELTPTLKLKRKIILDKYKGLVEKIYS
jgi:long-chain acyl-CoA synthetase